MSNKTSNLVSPKRRKLSREARARMAEAGKRNLLSWHERAQQASETAVAEVDSFRRDLFAELGPNATITRRALAENAVMTYASIVFVNKELRRPRNPERMKLVEKASWLSGNLTRLLKALALDARPKPRTLADVLRQVQPQNEQNKPSDGQK